AWGVDVNPLTQQLQRRMQRRSVLYLIGPGRVMDRVRQVPGMLARLPRTTWDLLRSGRARTNGGDEPAETSQGKLPDFHALLIDQFMLVQSRIDDALRASPRASVWIGTDTAGYEKSRIDKELAGAIADEQISDLRKWLEQKWNATPRDTAMLHK